VTGASSIHRRGESRLLALLPKAERERLLHRCERMAIEAKRLLFKSNSAIHHVYFPLSGMASLVLNTESGMTIEVGTVGNEGMVGMPVYFGANSRPTEGIWQVSGETLRMTAKDSRNEIERGGELGSVLLRFSQASVNQISQSVLCNHLHPIEQRLSRWLLMTPDRVGIDQFSLTQLFVAQMLGVRRASVTVAAGMLQKAGLIRYTRGNLTILDRGRLEASSCECYEVVKREFDRLLRMSSTSHRTHGPRTES
jgi:CRP-like cAMP-binding protein